MSPIQRWFTAGLAASWGMFPIAAHAHLGGSVSTIAADEGTMDARASALAMGRYTRHDLTRPNGGQVHEFANANGVVFAVSWAGPGKPDLTALLGPYFQTFQASSTTAARWRHSLRQPVHVAHPDLQIQSAGHMGWFHGVAFVPPLAPTGFAVSDLAPQP